MMSNDTIHPHWPKPLSVPAFADFRAVVLSVNKGRTLGFFEQMPEKTRTTFAPAVRAWEAFLNQPPSSSKLTELGFRAGQPTGDLDRMLQLLVLSACEFKDIARSLRTYGILFSSKDAERILRFRRPSWTLSFLERLANNRAHINSFEYWSIYRRFVHEKIIKRMAQ